MRCSPFCVVTQRVLVINYQCTVFDCFTPEDGTGCPETENDDQHTTHNNAEERRPHTHFFDILSTVHRDIFLQ